MRSSTLNHLPLSHYELLEFTVPTPCIATQGPSVVLRLFDRSVNASDLLHRTAAEKRLEGSVDTRGKADALDVFCQRGSERGPCHALHCGVSVRCSLPLCKRLCMCEHCTTIFDLIGIFSTHSNRTRSCGAWNALRSFQCWYLCIFDSLGNPHVY